MLKKNIIYIYFFLKLCNALIYVQKIISKTHKLKITLGK